MSYNIQHLNTAGRATIFTIITGVFCFAVAFIFNLGANEFNQAVAQQGDTSATTSVTVVNTPPQFVSPGAIENPASSTSTPTNSGDTVAWESRGVDANGESFYLLICSENATPTASGGGVPSCTTGIQWAVSGLTASNATATAATNTTETTLAGTDFALENDWFAFMCDNNVADQACTGTGGSAGLSLPQQGPDPYGTGPQSGSSTPFYINNPPSFTLTSNNSPTTSPNPSDPGETVIHYSTSTDGDNATTTDVADTVQLFVCSTQSFDYANQTCSGVEFASTTSFVASNASATDPIQVPTQDADYNAFTYIIDNHGHAATSSLQGATTTFRIDNVAPFVLDSSVVLNGGLDLILDQEASETTSFTLDFEISDNNYCVNAASSSEISNYLVSVYRATTTPGAPLESSSTTCLTTDAADYDPNNCYTSAVATTTWNLSCTASTTACNSNLSANDISQAYTCTFPLWYISDPTDGTEATTEFPNDFWSAQVAGVDDDNATGTAQEAASTAINLSSFLAFDLQTFEIPYGSLEPGQTTDDQYPGGLGLGGNTASSTVIATGNVGIDERLSGSSMCTTFTGTSTPCSNSATSTIDDFRQVFATSSADTFASASTSGNNLSSTSDQELEINVAKSAATSTPASGITYWGIEIPGTIELSGDYTGLNTFIAVVGESADW